jgi:hypothetical protein
MTFEPIPPAPRRGVENVARAYIEGLERDRRELHQLQQSYDRLVWETIQISAYAKALFTTLHQVVNSGPGSHINWDRVDELLVADRRTYHDVWSCQCGHHRYDHDDNGMCEYLACRHICGRSSDE